jgi:hypothetical protein
VNSRPGIYFRGPGPTSRIMPVGGGGRQRPAHPPWLFSFRTEMS